MLGQHEAEELLRILRHALEDTEHGLGYAPSSMSDAQLMLFVQAADGDARRALNLLEIVTDLSDGSAITDELIQEVVAGGGRRFDKGG